MASNRMALRLASTASSRPTASSSFAPLLALRSFSTSSPSLARSEKKAKASAAPATSAPPPPPAALALPDELRVGPIQTSRFEQFYHSQLADDLLYLTYSHKLAIDPDLPVPNPSWLELEPDNPYALNRKHPRPKGKRPTLLPTRKAITPHTVPKLEKITISMFVRTAIRQKSSLLGAIHALRTITGQVEGGGGDSEKKGVTILTARKGAATWHLRKGMPCGCKVELSGPEMYAFLETLTEFVFPRLREWKGLALHSGRREDRTEIASSSGVVSMGLEDPVMALFPQIEACMDAYPRMYGMSINFVTNQRGIGAQDRARQLLSGYRVPFFRPEPVKMVMYRGRWTKQMKKVSKKKKA